MRKNDPRTKEAVLDRMLSYDFDGDVRHLGAEPARLSRSGPNRLLMTFPASGITYEVVVRRPRAENAHLRPERRTFQADPEIQAEAPKTEAPKKATRKRAVTPADRRVRVQA